MFVSNLGETSCEVKPVAANDEVTEVGVLLSDTRHPLQFAARMAISAATNP